MYVYRLTISGTRLESDNMPGRSQQDEQSAETSGACDTGPATFQEIIGVRAENESSARAGFINAEPSIHWQRLYDIRAHGRGAVADAGVVNSFDHQEFLRLPPGRQLRKGQIISGVCATGGSSASAGYINAREQDFRERQEIENVAAHQRSVAVAGVARNFAHYQCSVIGDSRNDTQTPNLVQDAEEHRV
jgi:hypothetical protein